MCSDFKAHTGILNTRIQENTDHLLPNEQYGFRKGRSTEDPLGILINKIIGTCGIRGRDTPKGKSIYAIFIDFNKAFDSVDGNILLNKLKNLDVQGKDIKPNRINP